MKHSKWIFITCGLAVLVIIITKFIEVMAAPSPQILEPKSYLPIIIKHPTPTLPPTPAPLGVQILSNHSYYVDSIDYLHVVGEIWNNTGNNLRFVKIAANFFTTGGKLLDTEYTYAHLETLPAWDKTCFEITLPEPSGWSFYQFETPSYWTDGQPLSNLIILNDSGAYSSVYGWYEIIGQVRNDHGSRIEYVSPVGTIYNDIGVVLGCDNSYVNSTHLDPDQTSSFKMTFSGRDYFDVTSYRLQVDGNPVP